MCAFPCNTPSNDVMITQQLAKLEALILNSSGYIVVMGDFNLDPQKDKFKELIQLCGDHDLKVDDLTLGEHSYTYLGKGTGNKSWLDHCVSSSTLDIIPSLPLIASPSDHLPLVVDININPLNDENMKGKDNRVSSSKIKWQSISAEQKSVYCDIV